MKKILIIAFLILVSFGFTYAQTDYCNDIKKTFNGSGTVTYYDSPMNFISINKGILKGHKGNTSLVFTAHKKTADYDAGGIYVTFSDGTIWKYERKIDCSYTNADIGYNYGAAPLIHDDVIAMFKTKKIVKVQIADIIIPVNDDYATKFMAYMSCIDNLQE